MNTLKVVDYIVKWLKDYAESSKMNGFVVGVSGGIDSAVTSALCAKTGLPVLCVEMPIYQAESQVSRAKLHIENLKKSFPNVSSTTFDLSGVFDTFKNQDLFDNDHHLLDLSLANTRARLRMTTLYYFAGLKKYLVAGTGNKVEDFGVGFYKIWRWWSRFKSYSRPNEERSLCSGKTIRGNKIDNKCCAHRWAIWR